jgi:shikimate kinase
MRFVFLYGPPGVGKLTVGRELARLTGFKLFHNHLMVNAVQAVFPRGSDSWDRLIRECQCLVLAEAARAGVDLVMTWAHGVSEDIPRRYTDVVESNGGRVLFVRLVCETDVLLARVGHDERRALGKLTDPEILRGLLEGSHRPRPLPFGESLTIDTTDLVPAEAADQIADYFRLPRAASS